MEQASENPLNDPIAGLQELLGVIREDPSQPPSLEQLKKEARGYGKRRADKLGSRDNLIYRAGYAVDAAKGLGIDPDKLAGVLSCSSVVREVFQSIGKLSAGMSLVEVIELALTRSDVAKWAQQEGRYMQWKRLSALHEAETTEFKASAAFADPDARWRKKAPTSGQEYLISEICRIAGEEPAVVSNRGQAFDFIENAGGNPRYWAEPIRLERPSILGTVSQ